MDIRLVFSGAKGSLGLRGAVLSKAHRVLAGTANRLIEAGLFPEVACRGLNSPKVKAGRNSASLAANPKQGSTITALLWSMEYFDSSTAPNLHAASSPLSFLSIGVYIVGFYVATADIAKLQHHLVKKVNPIASTLIPSERDTLRQSLLDPAESEATWTALLQDLQCRSAFRIVPVRDTDFHHLRDAFVRAVQTRSNPSPQEFGDEAFGESVRTLKAIFNRGKLPKTRELLMLRDDRGALDVLYDDGKGRQPVGRVEDERVSRLLWLNYLAGKKVASEVARKNIIEGVMEFVERPVGTVATQVL
ncbi:hypothetical protein BN1723_010071 [Verticillium longisporum]|uniref:Chalcone isomerase domain-containing protein n=1 Tax=Verticillium longisporum TaxID=100787 RepID=A0A0G4KV19_VERLO|nr:hypothetical protein BN1723_010071 [Verticillium longisporum]